MPTKLKTAGVMVAVFLFFCLFLAAHLVRYEEEGGYDNQAKWYEERGTGFVIPFTRGGKFFKLSALERRERKLEVEEDFHGFPSHENKPSYIALIARPYLPFGATYASHINRICGTHLASLYESSQGVRFAIKDAIRKGEISEKDVERAAFISCFGKRSPSAEKILAICLQSMKREQERGAQPSSADAPEVGLR